MDLSATEYFAALSHETRLRCLMLLAQYEELCVCELTHALGAAQPHISRHLSHLREAGLISDRRDGLWVYYRLNSAIPDWIQDVLRSTCEGIAEQLPFAQDVQKLESMPNRPDATRCA